jgi:hypothetical protein
VNHIADFGNGNDGDSVDRHLRNFTQSISLRGTDFEPESIHITAKHHRQKANHDAGVPPPLSSNLTSVAAPATAAGHRGGDGGLLALPQNIVQSYNVAEESAVRGLVRFLAQIVPKCFT